MLLLLLLSPCLKGTEILLKMRSETIIIVISSFVSAYFLCCGCFAFWHNFAITKLYMFVSLPGAGG